MLMMTAREQAGLCGERRLKLQTAGCTEARQMHSGQPGAQRTGRCTEDRQMHSGQPGAAVMVAKLRTTMRWEKYSGYNL